MVADTPGMALYNAAGQNRATLGVTRGQTHDGKTITYPESSLLLYGADGKVTVWSAP